MALFFVISVNFLFSCAKFRHGPAERRAGIREKPGGSAIAAKAGPFSGWRMESRARPEASGHDRIRRGPPWITKRTQLPETKVTSNSYKRQGGQEAPEIAGQRRGVAGWKK